MTLNRRHLLTLLPLIGATGLGLGFARMLQGLTTGRFDPHAINNPLTHHAVPHFAPLSGLTSSSTPQDLSIPGFSYEELTTANQPILLNIWASWCLPCVEELPFLTNLAHRHTLPDAPPLTLWGMAYKDTPANAERILQRYGQPFQRLGIDDDGTTAIEWGVTGVPESFLILPGGRIVWHTSSSLTEDLYQTELLPLFHSAS